MTWDIEIAKQFKKRDNSSPSGPLLGQVLSISPLKIGILNNKVFLDEENCYLCSNVVENQIRISNLEIEAYTVSINSTDSGGDTLTNLSIPTKIDYSAKITFEDILKVNDLVLLIPTSDMQKFFIIDKVVI